MVTAVDTGEVLMVAHMNAEALAKTLATGEAWYYSRSRQALWKKGETSGHVQRVVEMRVDCDQDVLLLKVEQAGAGACHTGRRTCFYRVVVPGAAGDAGRARIPRCRARIRSGESVWSDAGRHLAEASPHAAVISQHSSIEPSRSPECCRRRPSKTRWCRS